MKGIKGMEGMKGMKGIKGMEGGKAEDVIRSILNHALNLAFNPPSHSQGMIKRMSKSRIKSRRDWQV